MTTQRAIAGFYHDPPIWVGQSPVSHEQGSVVDFEAFHDELVRMKLNCGIELKVSREGLFAFDFSGWASVSPQEDMTVEGFEKAVDAVLQRTLVMNSFLVLLYTGMLREGLGSSDRMVVTPELVIPMDSLEKQAGMSFGNTRVSHLALSGYPSTYRPQLPAIMDDRISMRHQAVPEESIHTAARELDDLIALEGVAGLTLADLFLRGNKAYQEHNYSLSLIMSWAVIEKVLNRQWREYLAANSKRDGKTFIDSGRKKRLQDGRTFTAAVVIETLSMVDILNLGIYEDLQKVRKARNDWMHNLKAVESSAAQTAMDVCSTLLAQVMRVDLRGDAARRIHG